MEILSFLSIVFPFQNCCLMLQQNVVKNIFSTELFWHFDLNQVTIYPWVIFGTLHSVSLTYVSISKVKNVLMKCSEVIYKENNYLGRNSSHKCPSHFIFELMVKLGKYVPNFFFKNSQTFKKPIYKL